VTIAQPSLLLVSLIKVVVLLFLVLTAVAYLVWFERKVAAHLQGRWGPYRTGPHGLLQPLADGLKFLLKEDVTPSGADRFLFIVAPFLTMTLAISSIAIIPFGPAAIHIFGELTPLVVANVNVGLLILFAITSIGVYGVALSGWSSNSKYSLLGALRSSAQMISYEISLTLSIVGVLLLAGTFNLSELITRPHLGFRAQVEPAEPHAASGPGLFLLFRFRRGGNQPRALRPGGSGIGARGRVPYGVFQFQIRHVLSG
jgi:NADH-quinone oxidoreductase subunit H